MEDEECEFDPVEDGECEFDPVEEVLTEEVGEGVLEGTMTHSVWSTFENKPGGHGSHIEDPSSEILPPGQELQRKPD